MDSIMRKFYIHFSRSTKTFNHFSRLLQWYEGLPISHVLVEFDTPHLGQNFVYHSVVGNGVSFMTRKKFDKINEVMETYEIELPDEQYNSMRNALLEHCGEEYATIQNIGIVLVDLARRLGYKGDNLFKDGQNCSELIYRYVIPYICDNYEEISSDLVKPSQIREMLRKNGISPIFSQI